jgi:hypothetical protein
VLPPLAVWVMGATVAPFGFWTESGSIAPPTVLGWPYRSARPNVPAMSFSPRY